jgi:hypothetical protein
VAAEAGRNSATNQNYSGREHRVQPRTGSRDANGNLTSDGTNTYTWDARNHLSAISGAAPGNFGYVYDALNRRMSKAVAGTTTRAGLLPERD